MLRIVSEGGSGFGTKILDAETGQDVTKIVPISGAIVEIGQIVTAQIQLAMIETDVVAAKADFLATHPISKDLQPVAAITFRDRWCIEFMEDGTPRVRQSTPDR